MRDITVLMIGDVVGHAGLSALEAGLRPLAAEWGAALVVVNGENAADGYGLTAPLAEKIFACGADVITSGNHIWEKRDFWPYMEAEERMLRPANYPAGQSGRGTVLVEKAAARFVVINLQGRDFMALTDCPFRCFDRLYEEAAGGGHSDAPPLILVDFHAETSREKEALGFYLDGRAALVAGTHTHVQTADEKILPNGAAYISDLGMTGSRSGVIGMKAAICVNRFYRQIQTRMECAEDNPAIQGVAVKLDAQTGKALEITRINKAV
ncbi:MAG: YmdB family metallophosphoesterase [Spirochaetaceae bacterium]|nr:YmdB family metallophosphoesterase [Spirochaetaceae bacterium]